MSGAERGALAGAGRAEIELPAELFPFDGYDGVHDPLHARAVVLQDHAGRRVLVSVELPSLRDHAVDRLRDLVAELVGVGTGRVWIGVTHTLSGPHVRSAAALADPDVAWRNELLCARLDAAVAAATSAALAALTPCRTSSGRTSTAVNVNRDLPADGGWVHGANPDRYSAHELAVLRIDDRAGVPIAVLFGLDLRPSATEEPRTGSQLVSADCTGVACRAIEAARGGVAVFLPGAMADQMPRTTEVPAPTGQQLSAAVGAELAAAVRVAGTTSGEGRVPRFGAGATTVEVPVAAGATGPAVTLEVELLTIGDVALVGLRPELTSTLGAEIRAGSPWPRTLVCTMVNGGAKYLVDDESHELGTATAQASPFGPGAGKLVVDAAVGLLRSTHDAGGPR